MIFFFHQPRIHLTNKGGLTIVAMRHWPRGPLQNVKKGAFWRNFEGLLKFLYGWSQKPFDPSPHLLTNLIIEMNKRQQAVLGLN
jgi:hypothetical protein